MKQTFLIKTTFVKNGCSLSNKISRLYPGFKKTFEHGSVRKKIFSTAGFCWDYRLSLREMVLKLKFGETTGYCYSYLVSSFRLFKVFRLHAILHHGAGAVRAHSDKDLGYCYMIGRGAISCMLAVVIALFFCLYVKLFPSSIFKSSDF